MTPKFTPPVAHEESSVLLHGVSWDTYDSLRNDLDACEGQHVYLTYDRGDLEISSVLLHGVAWSTYNSLRRDLDARGQNIYLTYDRGDLEIMPPLPIHERWKVILGWLIEGFVDELGLDVYSLAQSTFRRDDLERGLEPDCCYYIEHASEVLGKDRLNLEHDPPPDLAIEVDMSHRSIDREPTYAAMGVPELWRLRAGRIQFLERASTGTYQEIERSIAFPFLMSRQLQEFIPTLPIALDGAVRRHIRKWVRDTFANPKP
jgi:Uma2 family endonuclease